MFADGGAISRRLAFAFSRFLDGDWPAWALQTWHIFWFVLKSLFIFFMFAMVKALVPRYRYDQLMRLGWKIFLPTSLAAVMIVAAWVTFRDQPGAQRVAEDSPATGEVSISSIE